MSIDKVQRAENATRLAREHLYKAADAIGRPWMVNGYGIFAEIGDIEALIATTMSHLKEAQRHVSAVKWPTERDYLAYEQAVIEKHRLEDEGAE